MNESTRFVLIVAAATVLINSVHSQVNPTILQDTRDLPKTDGTFGFLYRTEDGIAHAAKADNQGVIHGRYTYTDPTGLKVNFNYNAGSRVTPGYNYEPIVPAQPSNVYERVQTRARPRSRNDLNNNQEY